MILDYFLLIIFGNYLFGCLLLDKSIVESLCLKFMYILIIRYYYIIKFLSDYWVLGFLFGNEVNFKY